MWIYKIQRIVDYFYSWIDQMMTDWLELPKSEVITIDVNVCTGGSLRFIGIIWNTSKDEYKNIRISFKFWAVWVGATTSAWAGDPSKTGDKF